MGEPEPSVRITLREVYDQVVGMRDDVRSLAQDREATDRKLGDHEERLRVIERWKYGVPIASLAAIASAVAAVLKAGGA